MPAALGYFPCALRLAKRNFSERPELGLFSLSRPCSAPPHASTRLPSLMPLPSPSVLRALRGEARAAQSSAHVPYTRAPEAAALLLADGAWVPGVRVESASFSLLLPPLLNALTTATALDRRDVVAAALSRPLTPAERLFLPGALGVGFDAAGKDALVRRDVEALPALAERLEPLLGAPAPADPAAGVALARGVAARAHAPASRFPVGCVLQTAGGALIPGVNVEHEDWTRTLCAERSALGTAVTYGYADLETLYLSCPTDPEGTPCGACRQLLVELAPEAMLWMDRTPKPPAAARPADLLPGSFRGHALLPSADA